MAELEADCLKIGRGREGVTAKFVSDGGDAMQAKGKKLGQGVSMKSLKGTHFEVEIQEKLQQV